VSSTTTALPPFSPTQVNAAESAQWRQIVSQSLTDARMAVPAFLVKDMDEATQTVSVQIAIQEQVKTPDKGAQWWDVPPINMVPIIIPRAGGFCLTLPMLKGVEGLLIFCDNCFDFWWKYGQNNAPTAANIVAAAKAAGTTPQPSGSQIQLEVRRHHVHDCGFLPGMYSQPNILPNYSQNSAQLRTDDGSVSIDLSPSGIILTAPLVRVTENLEVGNGATGSFTTPTGQVVTVQDGIITNIY